MNQFKQQQIIITNDNTPKITKKDKSSFTQTHTHKHTYRKKTKATENKKKLTAKS